ncbi:MAG: NADH-quinone oxidoreductase subunit NuoN [Pseudomonadota bacterium]|nr:NADH-quinone oxidoreductase subunit NuoN [Pseudomonadota bacterium]
MNSFVDLLISLPELLLVVTAMGMMVVGVYTSADRAYTLISNAAVLSLFVAIGLVLFSKTGTKLAFNDLFINDGFAQYIKVIVLLAAALVILIGDRAVRKIKIAHFEYPILITFATIGMMLMVSANDLMSLYIGLELQSLALYVVAALNRDSLRSSEAGLKYFVLGALSSGMLLYGCSLIYGYAGTTSFAGLETAIAGASNISLGLLTGLVFLIVGLAFKVAAVPFHMWTPDVYEGAPTPVTAFFAAAPKVAAMALFVRITMGPFQGMADQWQQIIIVLSVLSMVLAALAAISQTNIKRLMAYSSIGHAGYALIGLGACTKEGTTAVLIYLAIYIVMVIGTFACILCMKRKGSSVEQISDLAGLGKSHPAIAAALLLFMFSMAGIPPLAGFFGKLYIFLAAIEAELYSLAVIGVLASVVGSFYYLRIVKVMYFDNLSDELDSAIGKRISVIISLCALTILLFFLSPSLLVDSASTAASVLFEK